MAKTRHLRFRVHQPLLNPFRFGYGRLTRFGGLTRLLLACLTTLLCLISHPVLAHFAPGISSPVAISGRALNSPPSLPGKGAGGLGLEWADPQGVKSQPISPAISSGLNATQSDLAAAPQWLQQGRDYYEAGQYAAAVKVWQQAVPAYQSQGDSLNQAMVLSNLALAYQALGQLPEAKNAIATSLRLLQSQPNTPEQRRILAQAFNTQGSLQMAQGQAQQALTTLQQATDTYRQVGDEAGVIRSLLNQAQVLRVLGLYRRELSTLTQVNQTLQTQPDSLLKVAGLRHLGNALRLIGDLNESRKVLQQSLEIAEKLASPSDQAAALLSLGNTARTQLQAESALQFYQQAAAIKSSYITQIQALVNQLNLIAEGRLKQDIASLTQPLLPQIQAQLTDLPAKPY